LRKRIAIDMDEVIADFVTKHINEFNKKFNEKITKQELTGCKLRDLRPDLVKDIYALLHDPGYFRDLGVVEGSQEVIKELNEHYEVYITTAAMEVPTSFTAKYEWLKEHFGFLHDMNFVFCGDKSIIHADYLIDDNVKHFTKFKGEGILFTSHHNVNITGYRRVNNWREVRELFL
jgi:5'(3')-deoxyribonucleotidase